MMILVILRLFISNFLPKSHPRAYFHGTGPPFWARIFLLQVIGLASVILWLVGATLVAPFVTSVEDARLLTTAS